MAVPKVHEAIPAEPKSERLNARLTPRAKALVQEAAALAGRSVTDFVAEAVQEKALATIRNHRIWVLNEEQSLAFARAILDPPEPTERQRAYAADYWSAVDDGRIESIDEDVDRHSGSR